MIDENTLVALEAQIFANTQAMANHALTPENLVQMQAQLAELMAQVQRYQVQVQKQLEGAARLTRRQCAVSLGARRASYV